VPSSRQLRAAIPPVIAFAAFVAVLLAYASSRAPHYDEAITMLLVSGDAHPDWPRGVVTATELSRVFDGRATFLDAARASVRDVHPPLYFVAVSAWRDWVSPSLEGVRWFSVICALLQAVLLYWLFKVLAPLRFPLLMTLLFCSSAMAVGLGTFARGYALAQLLLLIALAASVRPLSRTTLVLAGGACAAAQATHYFAFFPVAGIVSGWLWRFARERDVRLLVPPGLAVLGGLMVAPFALRTAVSRPDQFAGFSGWFSEIGALLLNSLRSFHPFADSLGVWAWAFAAAGTAVLLVLGIVAALRRRLDDPLLVAAAALVVHMAGILLIFAVSDKTLDQPAAARYLSLTLPLAVVVMGYGAERLPRPAQAFVPIALVLVQAFQLTPGLFLHYDAGVEIVRRAASERPVVVAAGFGRGIPAVMALELDPATRVCVLRPGSDCDELLESSPSLVPGVHESTPTASLEAEYLARCPGCRLTRILVNEFP